MEDRSHDIEVLPPRKTWRKKILLPKRIPSLSPVKSKKIKAKKDNAVKPKPIFDKWIMPPEPEGYIKCPRYDFL